MTSTTLDPTYAAEYEEPIDSVSSSDQRSARLWILGFITMQFVCQLALLNTALTPFRVVFRSAAFLVSLVALVMVPGFARANVVRPWLAASLAIVLLMMMHPTTNSPLVGIAHLALYVAIAAPVVWVARLQLAPATFLLLVTFLWLFHTVSASFGVLQTLYPGRFDMPLSTIVGLKADLRAGLQITLASGVTVFRPSGLTDAPGGASNAGLLAYIFGLGFMSTSRKLIPATLGCVSISVGIFCMLISQVRMTLVLALIATLMYVFGLSILGRLRLVWLRLLLLPVLIVAGGSVALAVGGTDTAERLQTLMTDKPLDVYESNRGLFLRETFDTFAPQYPFGAGLGRWGMIRSFFGDENNLNSPPIWVEIQFTAWVLDGGLPLLFTYGMATMLALWYSFRLAMRCPDRRLAIWGFLIVGYDVGILAVMFSYVPFIGQMGLEYWLLNVAFWTAVNVSQESLARDA